jgi:prephenate dehydratase
MAARNSCPECEPLPCEQFEVAFQALSQWMAERAVLPIENSLGGSIHAVYDLLLRYRLHIVGETSVAVNHCLLALPGTQKGDLTRAMSHPQALAQCDGYLRSLGVVREAVDDTAGAAQAVSQQRLVGVAAVASRRAAELYGLDILDEGIQDMKDNVTRFLVLSRCAPRRGRGCAMEGPASARACRRQRPFPSRPAAPQSPTAARRAFCYRLVTTHRAGTRWWRRRTRRGSSRRPSSSRCARAPASCSRRSPSLRCATST